MPRHPSQPETPIIEVRQDPYGQGVWKDVFAVGGKSFWTRPEALRYMRSLRKARSPGSQRTRRSEGAPPARQPEPVPEPLAQPAAKPLAATVMALVVRSPWVQEIASGEKKIEYRCWRTKYRGWLAIVAARRGESRDDAGRVVCLRRIADCVEVDHREFEWNLSNPIPLTQRVEIPGWLGLFDVTDTRGTAIKPPPASSAVSPVTASAPFISCRPA